MGANDATVIVGTLSDEQLVSQINKLVNTVDSKTKAMSKSFDNFVDHVNNRMKEIGNIKIDSGTVSDSGSTKAVNAQKELGQEIERTTKKAKEQNLTFDQSADVMEKITRSGLRMNFNEKELDSMKQKLRELEAEYTKINREGGGSETQKRSSELRAQIQALNEEIKQYEASLKGLRSVEKINVPFDVKEWVENIDRVDNRLKQLNKSLRMEEVAGNKSLRTTFAEALKMPTNNIDEIAAKLLKLQWVMQEMRGTDILSPQQLANGNAQISVLLNKLEAEMSLKQQIKAVDTESEQAIQKRIELEAKYGDEVRNAAQIANEWMQKNKRESLGTKEGDFVLQAQESGQIMGMSLENQLLRYKERNEQLNLSLAIEKAIADEESRITAEKEKQATSGNTRKSFGDYEDLRQAIASVLHIRTQEVSLADKQNASYNALSSTLKQLQQAYHSLSGSQRDSLNAELLIKRIHETQRAMQEIQKQMSRPESIDSAMALPEKTLDEITYKIQMLRSYVQGVNIETENGEAEVKRILNYVDSLNEKTKNIQKTSKQINADTISRDLGKFNLMPESSYQEVANKYKQLKKYVDDIKNSKFVDEKSIERAEALLDRLARKGKKLQENLGTNKNVQDAMGMSANTLDEIARKMQRLQAIRSNLNINTQKTQIDSVNGSLAELSKLQDSILKKNSQMVASNTALGRSWNYMKNRLAFYFTVGASTQFVKNLIEVRSQYEMNERALGILINSAERGTQVFNQLSQMALVSPYTLIELSSAAKQLTAYDIAAKDVVDTTRRLADMASAVGVPMERLTYALGQIKAYGYLNSRDARMFANAGIPLVKQLSDYYTQLEGKMVSVGDVYDRMKKKAIDYNDVMAVVTKMTDEGGKFFDFQAKMADTLKVRLANLTLAWNNMLNEIGEETQGVLSFGIQGLKELFLRWKDINSALTKIIVTLGVIKGAQMLWYIAAYNTNKAIALQTVLGAKLATTMKTAAMAMASLATNPMTWIGVAVAAVGSLVYTIIEGNKAMKEFNKTLRQGAENNFNDVKNFVEQYKELRESLFKTVEKTSDGKKTSVPTKRYQDIDENEAKKAWEAVREQIELSTRSSDEYISRLLTITNMSDRLRESFNILDDINVVNAALKEMDDDTIAIANDWSAWWNLWKAPDGLVKNLNQYTDALNKVNKEYGSLEKLSKKVASGNIAAVSAFADVEAELLAFKNDIDETNKSILNFINLKGWSGDTNKINQVFKQIGEKLIEENQLDPQKAFSIQIEMENARAAAAKQALSQRIADEKAALAVAASEETKAEIQERLNALLQEERDFSDHNGRNKVEWERFTKWLKEQHLSEMTEMFRGMDAEQIKSLNFQEGKHADWVKRMVEKYAKEHKMSYDDAFSYLKSWVSKANTWSIFIPLTISTEDEKSVFKNLEEADKAADEAWKKMQRLDKRIAQLKKKGARNVGQEGLVADATDEDKEYTKALQERADAQRDYNKAVEEGGESKKENAAGAKAQKAAESELQKALKEELQLIDNVRNAYKKMDEEGVGHFEAVQKSTSGLEESIKHVNSVLSKYGIGQIDFSKFAGVQNPRAIIDMLNKQIDNLLRSGVAKPEEVKDLEIKVSSMKLDVTSFDQKTITESLNSELARLKDEYELSVALDADPELGDMFANWIGFDPSLLTSSVQEYATEYTRLLNKYLKEKGADIELPSLDLTDDDIREFERMVKDNTMNKEWVEAIKKGVKEIRDLRRKDAEDTSREWNKLVEKYGGLQAKMVKIYKDTVNEQVNIAKKFGSNEDITAALDLSRRINISQDPEEIARLQTELSKIMDKVVENNPKAINVYTATQNKQGKETAKANWEDFKDSNLYAMTFEDMENVSTRAIKSIIDKLDDLKNKVGEDPASMKALVKSIEDARKELEKRNPFAAIVQGNKEWKEAVKELEQAQKELEQANKRVDGAKIALDNAKAAGSTDDVAAAQEKLDKALNERASADEKVVKAENKMQKANGKIISGLQNLSGKLNDIKGLFDTVSQMFREFGGDDGTADAIDEISKGFTIMTTIIMGVVAAMILLETTQPWLLAIAAALSVIVGLVSFLSGQHNKNIDKKVKASELAVKRLENAYIDLEQAADKAYGTATIGAQKAMLANKELQIAELRRQLQLERSRKSKDRDQDKIEDLKKQIKELEYEISNGTKKIVDDLLGVSSAGSFAEDLVSSMIESFRQGEDYMKVFEEKFEDMIDNMIMKAIVSRVVSSYIDKLWDNLDQQIAQRSKAEADAYAAAQAKNSTVKNMTDEEMKWMMMSEGMKPTYGLGFRKEEYDAYRKAAQEAEDAAKKRLEAAETFTDSDMDYVMAQIAEIMPELGEKLKSIIGEYYKFGDKAENATLSALQQGIQGITEDTAGALEAYMNGVSQQVYLQSSILMEIRDVVVGMNGDVGLGVQAQMLLQLQQSYVVQTAIQNILAGVVNPSGRAFSVEIIS